MERLKRIKFIPAEWSITIDTFWRIWLVGLSYCIHHRQRAAKSLIRPRRSWFMTFEVWVRGDLYLAVSAVTRGLLGAIWLDATKSQGTSCKHLQGLAKGNESTRIGQLNWSSGYKEDLNNYMCTITLSPQ